MALPFDEIPEGETVGKVRTDAAEVILVGLQARGDVLVETPLERLQLRSGQALRLADLLQQAAAASEALQGGDR